MVGRFCLEPRVLKGFAVRDFGGIRLHMPTLDGHGYSLDSVFPGSAITSDNLHDVWAKAHHTIFQNHLGQLLTSLHLQVHGGWAVVREEVLKILKPEDDSNGEKLYQFFVQEYMPFKCFIKMKMDGKYRDVRFQFFQQ
jgi:siderophore synthetase component